MWTLQEQKAGFFNQSQLSQLEVLFNCIFPGSADRNIPNATEAGAVNFLHLLLARDESVYYEIRKWRTDYPTWLVCLNEQSKLLFKTELQYINTLRAITLMEKLEQASLNNFSFGGNLIDQLIVFDTLRRHCIQGCFSDPRWGGNKNNVMWQAYGYQEDLKY